jgi:transposase
MGQFVQGIKTLFSGPDTSAEAAQIAAAKQDQTTALARQQQQEQNADQVASTQAGLVSRQPRGRRLLLAATGESGVAAKSATLG